MIEAFGLAGVSESAVVVCVSTRPGPATGMPTWTEQSDLRYVIHAAQGEFPRVVLAPGDREDAFRMGWQAFNIADQLQTPVLILGDSYLSDHRASVAAVRSGSGHDRSRQAHHTRRGHRLPALRSHRRRHLASARFPASKAPNRSSTPTSTTSTATERRARTPTMRLAQNEKRMRKYDLAREIVPRPPYYGPERGRSLHRAVRHHEDAGPRGDVRGSQPEGIAVNMMQVATVWPFPAEEVAAFLGRAKRTAVIEGNFTGQLQSLDPAAVSARCRPHAAPLRRAAVLARTGLRVREGGARLMPDGQGLHDHQQADLVSGVRQLRHVGGAQTRAVRARTSTSTSTRWCGASAATATAPTSSRRRASTRCTVARCPWRTALKLAQPDLKVIVESGDGDGYGLGLGHFVHSAAPQHRHDLPRARQPDLRAHHRTGLPHLGPSHASVSTPKGVLEEPVNPIGLALAEGATFVARGFAGDIPHLTELYKQAIQHHGFALVDVLPAVRDLEQAQHVLVVPRARLQARGNRLGPDAIARGIRTVDEGVPRPDLHARRVPGPHRRLLPRGGRRHIRGRRDGIR